MNGGEGATADLREKARKMLEAMCALDGTSFPTLQGELQWPEHEVQRCLEFLSSQGYVAVRALPSLHMRYSVTNLGWSVSELLASMDDPPLP